MVDIKVKHPRVVYPLLPLCHLYVEGKSDDKDVKVIGELKIIDENDVNNFNIIQGLRCIHVHVLL